MCLRTALENNAVTIHLGGQSARELPYTQVIPYFMYLFISTIASGILQIMVESLLQGTTLTVIIAIVQQDGNIHRLHLSADDNVSFLESLVLSGEGTFFHATL